MFLLFIIQKLQWSLPNDNSKWSMKHGSLEQMSSLVWTMACRIFRTKVISQAKLAHCRLDHQKRISMKRYSKYKNYIQWHAFDNVAHKMSIISLVGYLNQHGLTLIPAWIYNHLLSKVWSEINYPFQNFNGFIVEVWRWISNFIPHFLM